MLLLEVYGSPTATAGAGGVTNILLLPKGSCRFLTKHLVSSVSLLYIQTFPFCSVNVQSCVGFKYVNFT